MLQDIPIIAWLALAGLLVTALIRRFAIARSANKTVGGTGVCGVAGCRHQNSVFAEYCAKCGSKLEGSPTGSGSNSTTL